jgi:hypothetical protein
MFTAVATGDSTVKDGAPVPPPVARITQQAPQWGVEYEQDMRRDIAGLTRFIVDDLAPVIARQKDTAQTVAAVRSFDNVLRGCAGAPGIADYAWALNETLARALPLFTALEVMIEREENFPVAKASQERYQSHSVMMGEFETRYRKAARWLHDMNSAFALAYPDAAARIRTLQEQGDLDGNVHEEAEADIYSNDYPLVGTAPLRQREAIFAPYARPRAHADRALACR